MASFSVVSCNRWSAILNPGTCIPYEYNPPIFIYIYTYTYIYACKIEQKETINKGDVPAARPNKQKKKKS